MLSYKQRYKPRTEREYTKTDLIVYDSAGNTALRGVKVYGKSEVVDGEIVSAGDSGSITITSNNNTSNLITSIIQGAVSSEGSLLPDNTTRVMTTPIYIEPNTEIFLNSNSVAQVFEVNEWDENDNFLGYYGINNTSGSRIVGERTHKIIVTFRYSNNASITPEIVPNATITLTPSYTTTATFSTGTPLYGLSDTVRDVMVWDGTSGEVTKNCAKVRLADLTWQWWNQHPNVIYANITDRPAGRTPIICSNYPYNTLQGFSFASESFLPDKMIYTTTMETSVFIKNTDYNTKEDFIASLGDAELVYELATPTTTPLTQTENESIASLRTFDATTHFINNATTDMTVNYTIKVPTI